MTKVWIELTALSCFKSTIVSAGIRLSRSFVAATAAATLGLASPLAAAEKAEPPSTGVQVTVAKATNACFSDMVRVTGFVVPRREAVVIADSDGKVTDVLVREGDVVTDNQELVRTASAPTGPKSLRAPAAGLITEAAHRRWRAGVAAGRPGGPHRGRQRTRDRRRSAEHPRAQGRRRARPRASAATTGPIWSARCG